MNIYYVYMYLDLDNVPFYIGKGKGKRYYVSGHLHKNNTNFFLKNKIRKVGTKNVKIHFLHENITEEEAFRQEKYWIKYYGRRDLGTGTLCNLTDGGEGESGRIFSDEHKQKISVGNRGKKVSDKVKQKMSKAAKGRIILDGVRQKISNSMKGEKNPMYGKPGYWIGRTHTDEAKQKMRDDKKGKKLSNAHKQKISDSKKCEKHPMYGKFHSDATKQKMSEAAKGRIFSDKTREKMSNAAKGRIPWNKSKKIPEEAK